MHYWVEKVDTEDFENVLSGRERDFECECDSGLPPGARLKIGQAFKLYEMDPKSDKATGRRLTVPIASIVTGSLFGVADGMMRVVYGEVALEVVGS